MKPAVDAETLIACLACAKAKAKCDKRVSSKLGRCTHMYCRSTSTAGYANTSEQLPTCSRCIFKRQKCEPRQPRRYPETFQLFQSESQSHSPMTSQPASSPSAQNVTGAVDQITYAQDMFEGMQWPQDPMTPIGPETDGFAVEATGSMMQQYDPTILNLSTAFFASGDTSMDYSFSRNIYDIGTPQSQSPPADTVTTTGSTTLVQMEGTPASHLGNTSRAIGLVGATDEDWPCFCCNPPTQRLIDPLTGGKYLMRLEKTLDELPDWRTTDFSTNVTSSGIEVNHVDESLRDKLMVIAQGFFSRARDVHRAGIWEATLSQRPSLSHEKFTGFFILPPAFVLEAFLRIYASRVEPYMPFFPGNVIDAAKLIASHDEKVSVLLLLLMMAHGAMGCALREAQEFASGLIETCRICIFDVMEKNVQLSAHPVMLRCALLYLQASIWSGNKWHMDVSTTSMTRNIANALNLALYSST
jgi:hypothetical protein